MDAAPNLYSNMGGGVKNVRLGENNLIPFFVAYVQQLEQTSGFALSIKGIDRLLFLNSVDI